MIKKKRENIQNIFQQALDLNQSTTIVHDTVVDLYHDNSGIHVIAIGKSAAAMLEGAIMALNFTFSRALLITKSKPSKFIITNSNIETIIAGHPIPDENSLLAGKKLIQFLANLKSTDQVLFLISGGTSSLVEYLPDTKSKLLTLDELQALNKWLLASDKNIMDVNQIRKKVSGIKAGRLLDYIQCEHINLLAISDVPDDDLKNIGSGLLTPDDVSREIENLPDWINKILKKMEGLPEAKDNADKKIVSQILFSNSVLRKNIAEVALLDNISDSNTIHTMDEFISGNTIEDASRIGEWLITKKKGLYIWGAETHMALPDSPGRGGRNQSFALALALKIQKHSKIVVLVAGTDGNDGNTDDAGAIVDGDTIRRGEENGASVTDCIKNANAGEFLSASGDLLTLGITGTNVMDIIIAIIWD